MCRNQKIRLAAVLKIQGCFRKKKIISYGNALISHRNIINRLNNKVRDLEEIIDIKSKHDRERIKVSEEYESFFTRIDALKKELKQDDITSEKKYYILIKKGQSFMEKLNKTELKIKKSNLFSRGLTFKAIGTLFKEAIDTADINKEESLKLCIDAYKKAIDSFSLHYDYTKQSEDIFCTKRFAQEEVKELSELVKRISS